MNLLLIGRGAFAFCFALLLGPISASAQNAAPARPQPPPGDYVASMPDFSRWLITFSYPEDRTKSPNPSLPGYMAGRPRARTTTITKEIIHEETVNINGDKTDAWRIRAIQYQKPPGSTVWYQAPARAMTATGFSDLEWITGDDYIGTVRYAGRTCLVFAGNAPADLDVSKLSDPTAEFNSLNQIAFIEADSRLPVETRAFGVIRYFKFMEGPTEKLTFPADLAEHIRQNDAIEARLSGHAPPAPPPANQ